MEGLARCSNCRREGVRGAHRPRHVSRARYLVCGCCLLSRRLVQISTGREETQTACIMLVYYRSIKYDKIRGDSFRTFPNEPSFKQRVSEESLIRLLNNFVHKYGMSSPLCPASSF